MAELPQSKIIDTAMGFAIACILSSEQSAQTVSGRPSHQQLVCETPGLHWTSESQRRALLRVLRRVDRGPLLVHVRQWLYEHLVIIAIGMLRSPRTAECSRRRHRPSARAAVLSRLVTLQMSASTRVGLNASKPIFFDHTALADIRCGGRTAASPCCTSRWS